MAPGTLGRYPVQPGQARARFKEILDRVPARKPMKGDELPRALRRSKRKDQ
jgi:hypothetical protein